MSTTPAHRPPRWERRKEERPAELVAAALELFVERGYAAARLDDVAARAGVSKGTLYLYFDSKEELFKGVVRHTIVPLIDAHQRNVEQSELSSPALIERFFREWWEQFGSTRLAGIAKLILAEAGNFPEVAQFFHDEVILPNGAVLAGILQRGIERGEFRPVDVEVAAHLWIAPMVMKALWAHSYEAICASALHVDAERFLRVHTEFVLAALRPDGGERARRAGSAAAGSTAGSTAGAAAGGAAASTTGALR